MMRPHPPLPAVSSADLRGVFRPAAVVAGDRLALPHDVGRTVSGAPAARSCGEPLRYNEEGLGRVTVAPETACRTRPGSVHVDPLRRWTLRATTSLVTRRFAVCRLGRSFGRAPGRVERWRGGGGDR